MKNIDFLPELYRHKRALRHSRLCWMGVGMLFGLAISGAASGQWLFRVSLAAQLQIVEPQYVLAMSRQAELAKLESDKGVTEELAALYTYLDYPWPRTQLLAAIAEALPEAIQLTDLHVLEQAEGTTLPTSADTNHSDPAGDKAAKPTAKTVLAHLRDEHDHQQTILELSGLAPSDKEVHEYVDTLGKSPLIVAASLKGLESGGVENKTNSRFHIRVVVRPGYGQHGAPAAKAGTAQVAVEERARINKVSSLGGTP